MNDLIRKFNILTLEENYKNALSLCDRAFNSFESIELIFKNCFSEKYSALPYELNKNNIEITKRELTKRAWRFIIVKMQIDSFISADRKKKLNNMIEQNQMPEFNAENITNFVLDAANNVNTLVQEAATEVFNFIKPYHNKHKTNEYSKGMPPKIVLTGIMDSTFYPKPYVSYYYKDHLKDLDNIFHLLDGRGAVKYACDLVTAIETSDKFTAETEYFAAHWYKNGNLHLIFKRMDLADKLAQIGSKNILHN